MEIEKIKSKVCEYISTGRIDVEVVQVVTGKDGSPVAKECDLWDYKREHDLSKVGLAKCVKAIVSLHNSYGGYLIYGVEEVVRDAEFKFVGIGRPDFDVGKLRANIAALASDKIDVTYAKVRLGGVEIGVLHVPKRSINKDPMFFDKDQSDESGGYVFKKKQTYFRWHDQCQLASTSDHFKFLHGSRNYLDRGYLHAGAANIIENNLPDKNFICPVFLGRSDLISELWAWLGDEFEFAKVLAGEGGRGKTSIAYEFSKQIAESGIDKFEFILWLTAKKRQFSGLKDQYLLMPETHFHDLESMLKSICMILGGEPESDLHEVGLSELKRKCKSILSTIKSFVVIDDIDSTDPDEQKRILEVARVIAGHNSRILITTRANLSYSTDTCIEVPGFPIDEFREFVTAFCKRQGIKQITPDKVSILHKVSAGSPLYAESIFRLVKLGVPFERALEEWRGKSGDAAREATLLREIQQLSPHAKLVLLAASIMESCSYTELIESTQLDSVTLHEALQQLGALFLISAEKLIESEARYEVSSNTAKIVRSVFGSDGNKYRDLMARTRGLMRTEGSEAHGRFLVGRAISQGAALIRNGDPAGAEKTAQALLARARFKNHPDLLFLVAKARAANSADSIDRVRFAFRHAYECRQRKTEFFHVWFRFERDKSISNAISVADKAIDALPAERVVWLFERALASIDAYRKGNDFDAGVMHLWRAVRDVAELISISRQENRQKYVELSREVTSLIWEECVQASQYRIAFDMMSEIIRLGDLRSYTFFRCLESLEQIRGILHGDEISNRRKKELAEFIRQGADRLHKLALEKRADSEGGVSITGDFSFRLAKLGELKVD
jgi:hypothetical protein